jgi:hypothetical protein
MSSASRVAWRKAEPAVASAPRSCMEMERGDAEASMAMMLALQALWLKRRWIDLTDLFSASTLALKRLFN